MAWWPFGRNRREPAALPTPATQAVIRSVEPDGAWRDLPTLQRTLADPLQPMAINEDFRDSLASYADPSFVAPLAHQVDPAVGGLVEGLVSPGTAYAHPSGPELAVLARAKPPAKPRVSASAAPMQTPSVQRNVTSSGSTDLSTVALGLPETGWSAQESQPPGESEILAPAESSPPVDVAIPAGTPAPNEGAVPPETPRAVEIPSVQRRTDAGSNARAPMIAPREFPSAESVASSRHTTPRGTTKPDLPVVSRLAKPAAESAPQTGFAAAITNLTVPGDVPAEPGSAGTSDRNAPVSEDQAGRHDDDHAVADDHPARTGLPAPDVPIQRLTGGQRSTRAAELEAKPVAEVESEANLAAEAESESNPAAAAESESNPAAAAEPPVVVPSPASVSDIPLPVVSRRSETPTLGGRLAESPLSLQRAPLTERVSPPIEPAVQRVEFVAPQVAPARPPEAAARRSFQAPRPVTTPEPSTRPTPAPVAPPSVQRLPSQGGRQGSNPPVRHLPAVSRRETQVREAVGELAMPQLGSFEPVVAQRVTSAELRVRPEVATPEVNVSAVEVPVRPATEVAPEGPGAETPTGQAVVEVPAGPAVIPELWASVSDTPAPSGSTAAPGSTTATSHSALPTVSRLTADAAYRTPSPARPSPALAVGPSIPRVTPYATSSQSGSGRAMSFTSMFSSAADETEAGSPAETGFTSVQLQSASESSPPASEPATDTSAAPPVTTPVPPPTAGGGAPSADLDEMARRLYEPLTARLRAELWLDRERAGVTSDL
jgi:hypothetical protein